MSNDGSHEQNRTPPSPQSQRDHIEAVLQVVGPEARARIEPALRSAGGNPGELLSVLKRLHIQLGLMIQNLEKHSPLPATPEALDLLKEQSKPKP